MTLARLRKAIRAGIGIDTGCGRSISGDDEGKPSFKETRLLVYLPQLGVIDRSVYFLVRRLQSDLPVVVLINSETERFRVGPAAHLEISRTNLGPSE